MYIFSSIIRFIKNAILSATKFFILFFLMAYITIIIWIIISITEFKKRELFLPAWYPFNIKNQYGYLFALTHQSIGWFCSVNYLLATEHFPFALMCHLNAQIQRLGYSFSNVGKSNHQKHQNNYIYLIPKNKNELLYKNNVKLIYQLNYVICKINYIFKKDETHYAEIIECILLHQVLLE